MKHERVTKWRYDVCGLILYLTIVMSSSSATRYVWNANTNPASPYTNGWGSAASNIQDAVNVSGSADLILVTNGTYLLTNHVVIPSGVTLRSFNNGMPDPTNTIVDANGISRGFYLYGVNGAVLDGFTIQNGLADNGGGVYIYGYYNVLTNCFIGGNRSTNESSYGQGGGGGVFLWGLSNSVVNCRIVSNSTMACGGGIGMRSQLSTTVVANCSILWNTATNTNPATISSGGGIFMYNCSDVFVSNCVIANNVAYQSGGGVALDSGGYISDCLIVSNQVQTLLSGFVGGGGGFFGASVVLRCRFIGNNTMWAGGGITAVGSSTLIKNCLIVDNVAPERGGGIYSIYGATVVNTTISSNQSDHGGIYEASDTACYTNVICYFNSGAYSNFVPGNPIKCVNSCIAPTTGLAAGSTNNISTDPLFVDMLSGNYRLSRQSPCVNSGINQDWMNNEKDLDGHHRLDVFSGIVDIGCYEYMPSGTMYGFR